MTDPVTETDVPQPTRASSGPPRVDVAVIGGSGLYSLFAEGEATRHVVETPYGPTSSEVTASTSWSRKRRERATDPTSTTSEAAEHFCPA